MWPSKKKKGITLQPGEGVELEIVASWNKNKNEVTVITDSGQFILGEKSELFLEIKGDNVEPLKIQIIPDFKNRKLDLVEIIDLNAKPTNDNVKISLEGISETNEKTMPLDECLKRLDKDLTKLGELIKMHRKIRNISTLINVAILPLNIYVIITNRTSVIYFNMLAVVVQIYLIYYLWNKNMKLQKIYENGKRLREKMFGTVKEE